MNTQYSRHTNHKHRHAGGAPFSRFIDELMNTNIGDVIETALQANRAFVNVFETDRAFALHIAAPGLPKSDFAIEVKDGKLHISANHNATQLPEGTVVRSREFDFGKFHRVYTLDERVDAEKITAKYENGVLILDLPKRAPETWSRNINVE